MTVNKAFREIRQLFDTLDVQTLVHKPKLILQKASVESHGVYRDCVKDFAGTAKPFDTLNIAE